MFANSLRKQIIFSIGTLVFTINSAHAASMTSEQTTFIFNTLLFLISGAFVMWMAAGFAMLESGLVRSKNVAVQCTKNIGIYSIAALAYGLIGYNLMYPSDGQWLIDYILGDVNILSYLSHDKENISKASGASDFFFQMAFCATTASIVSGAVAERVKLSAFFIFTLVLTAILYPIVGSWKWGGGFLEQIGFSDFAGSTLVHSAGGWAALAGVIVIGARHGRFKDGKSIPIRASNLPLATLGCFILWLGWFFFNGGSQLALGTLEDAADISRIFVNTNTAAAAGAIGCLLLSRYRYGKIDPTMMINGALGGLVAITAEPLTPTFLHSAIFGLIASGITFFTVETLDKLKIDDVVGAIPVHLACGIFGTVIVPFTNDKANYMAQILGIVVIGIFVFIASLVTWKIINIICNGLRPTIEDEIIGLDQAELGMDAYNDFVKSGA